MDVTRVIKKGLTDYVLNLNFQISKKQKVFTLLYQTAFELSGMIQRKTITNGANLASVFKVMNTQSFRF